MVEMNSVVRAGSAMSPTRRERNATNSMTMSLGEVGSAGDPKVERCDIGVGRGCCASARGRRRGAWNPGGRGYSERETHSRRGPSNDTGLARRNSSRCCHNSPPRIALWTFVRWPSWRPPYLLPPGKQMLFSSAMSVMRDLFLMTPGTSGRVFQRYTSVNGSQWDSQISACHMIKMRADAMACLCIKSMARCWWVAQNFEVTF